MTIQLRATDTGGNATITPAIDVQLVPDTTPPLLIAENISENAVRSASFRTLTFTFSKPLDPASVTAANFALLGPGAAAVTPQSIQTRVNGKQVDVTYGTLPLGAYQFVIDASQVKDVVGNAMGASPMTTDFTVQQFSETWVGASEATGTPPPTGASVRCPGRPTMSTSTCRSAARSRSRQVRPRSTV